MIPGYEIQECVGAGATSRVYRARKCTGNHSFVAIKILREEHCNNPDTVGRFLNEVLPVRGLHHEGIPAIHECEIPPSGQGLPYLVMELLGPSLTERLQNGPLPLAAFYPLAGQIAKTLSALAGAGLVHRDLKPANLLFRLPPRADRLCLVDYGLAKKVEGGPFGLPVSTEEGTSLGTPTYSAPEQFLNAKGVDFAADLYSFGAILYEMLQGAPPFVDPDPKRLREMHLLCSPPSLSAPAPPPLRTLILRLLEKDRRRRPSLAEIHHVLGCSC